MPVDRDALAKALADPSQTIHYMVDRTTHKILTLNLDDKRSVVDVQQRVAADKSRYVQIPKIKGRGNYEEMERFIATVQDPHFKQALTRTLSGHRPFREFKDLLETKPKEKRAWEKFHQDTTDKRVTEFLRATGLP